MINYLPYRLLSALAETFTTMSKRNDIIAWNDSKFGIKMPRFSHEGWETVNAALVKLADDFIIADRVHNANEIKDSIEEISPNSKLLEKWALEHILTETSHRNAYYYDRPIDYNKIFPAVHSITFASMYPRILTMLWSNEYIKSENMFWYAYGIVLYYRGKLKLMLDRQAYTLMKMYLNKGIGKIIIDGDIEWRDMLFSYAHYVMSAVTVEVGIDNVIYADTDAMYVNVSLDDAKTAVRRTNCGLPYDIEYVSEIRVAGRKSYSIKNPDGTYAHHGKAATIK